MSAKIIEITPANGFYRVSHGSWYPLFERKIVKIDFMEVYFTIQAQTLTIGSICQYYNLVKFQPKWVDKIP